jgi:hypothetical protein
MRERGRFYSVLATGEATRGILEDLLAGNGKCTVGHKVQRFGLGEAKPQGAKNLNSVRGRHLNSSRVHPAATRRTCIAQ